MNVVATYAEMEACVVQILMGVMYANVKLDTCLISPATELAARVREKKTNELK